ncbi:MAG: Ig-like domain-containing protein [Intestinibacter bartlettii]|nr:Ig-like domain-containing protein [Intestinibacter bartlettii]
MSNITNLNRDYLIKINVKEATIDVPKMTFWNTDKKTSNMFVQLVINMSENELIKNYVTIENATDYKIVLNVIKPKTNQYRTIEATLLNEEKALFEIDLPDEFTDQVGDYSFEFEVSSKVDSNDESITTSNGTYKINGSILTNLNEETSSSPDLPILKQLIEQVKSLQGGDLTGYQKKEDETLETTSKKVVGAINEVNSQYKDIAKQLKDITTTGFTMIDVSSEDTYSINTGSTGGNTGETTIHVTGITITGQKNSLKIGETLQLTANIIPSNATNKNVEWTSTVVNYATVSDTGLVTAKDKGSVTIEATTEDGQFVARYNITIVADTTEGNNLIFELNSDDYTENSTTWTDSIRKIPCTLSAGVTKDATKGLLFTGKEKYETDISSLNISGNDAFTLIIEHTPTDNSGTFLSLLGLYTENDAVEKTLFEYRGFVSSDCLNYCGLSRVKLNHNVNERSVTGVSFGAKGSQVMVGNSNSINANKPTNSFDIPALLTSLKMAKSDNSNYYKGYIKSIRLYNKAMTEDEFKLVLGVNN